MNQNHYNSDELSNKIAFIVKTFLAIVYLLTLLLIFDAVPYSSASILLIRDTWSFGGIISEIILVPFLQIGEIYALEKTISKCQRSHTFSPSSSLQTFY